MYNGVVINCLNWYFVYTLVLRLYDKRKGGH